MRRLSMMFVVVTVLAAVSASASLLDVDGAVIQVFVPEVPAPVPGGARATITITPQSLNAGSNGEPLQVQITLNDGCTQEDIVFSSIRLRVAGEADTVSPDREISRNKNKLIVRFDREQVINLIGAYQGDEVTLEVSGHDSWGCEFTGYDTIKFKPSPNNLASDGDGSVPAAPDGSGDTGEPSTDTDLDTEESTDDDGESEPTTDEGSDTEQLGGDDGGSESSSEGDGGGSNESGSDGSGDSESGGADSP